MKATILTKPAFHVLGYALETSIHEGRNHREIPAFWERYNSEGLREHIPNKLYPEVDLGICTNFNHETGEFRYLIGFEVESIDEVPEGMVTCTVPEATYAVFTTPPVANAEFSSTIQQTWGQVFSEWFPASEYEPSQAIQFEWYDERSRNCTAEQMDLYIPIQLKKVEA